MRPSTQAQISNQADNVRRIRRPAMALWTLLLAGLLAWSFWDHYDAAVENARIVARSHFTTNLAYRHWNASIGGLYAPVTDTLRPNPHLDIPARDLVTTDGQLLTLINPAYMVRLVHEGIDSDYSGGAHITSLDPIRPENTPDPWERRALESFEQGAEEMSAVVDVGDSSHLRLMRPMIAEPECLDCHEHQGYRLGEVRGGISFSIPMAPIMEAYRQHVTRAAAGYAAIWLLGIAGIHFGARNLEHTARRKAATDEQLSRHEQELRSIVEDLPGLICRNRPDGEILFVNDAYCEFFGKTRDQLVGSSFFELIPERQRTEVRANLAALGSENRVMTHQHQVIAADGAIRIQRWTNRAIINPGGEVELLQAYGQDITDEVASAGALAESERRLSTLMNNLPGVAYRCRFNRNWTMEFVSENSEELTGYAPCDLIDDREIAFGDLIDAADRQTVFDELQKAIAEDCGFRVDYRIRRRDGAERWVREQGQPVRLPDDPDVRLEGLITDTTEERIATQRLRAAAAVFASTTEGVTVTDLDGTITEVNGAFCRITGYDHDEAIGQNHRILQSGRHDLSFYQQMWRSLEESGSWRGEIWNRRKDGTVYPELLAISTVTDRSGRKTGYVGVFSDITTLKQSEEELAHLAHHDALTDLPNRLLLNARLAHGLKRAQRHNRPLAVVFVDLDQFKHVNDSLGHTVGDRLLKALADRLQGMTRAEDTCARIGGDEFVVLLEDFDSTETLAMLVEKFIRAFADPVEVDGHSIVITASAGISIYPPDGRDPSTLMRNADAAMYRAKEEGRNTYQFYTQEMTASAFETVFLQSALQTALRRSEFRLLYQPQLDLASQRIIGVEALLRWEHPDQGTISPARFIPIAEQSGLIWEIGAWALAEACRQARLWFDQGLDIGRVAVNVSGLQIQDRRFVDLVRDTLRRSGLPEEHLALEITESFVVRHIETCIEGLRTLGQSGVEIAIDDFGTGYSSLSYLKRLPINKLKIDQSFVRDIPADANDMAIAQAVIAMGQALGMTVIAEGVETREQADFLIEKGCREGQGYLFSKPVSPQQIEAGALRSP